MALNATDLMTEEQKKNWPVALAISREARTDPMSRYVGKHVGIRRQEVVAVADTLGAIVLQLDTMGVDPGECTVIDADADYESTHYIWEAAGCRV
jgi:selenocysteine lyase/cysteine desulfurase